MLARQRKRYERTLECLRKFSFYVCTIQVNFIDVHAHKKWGVGAGRGNSPLVSDYTRYLYRSSHRAFPGQVSCHLSVLTNTSQPGFFSCSRDTYDTGFYKLLLPFPLRAPLLSGKEQPRDEKSPAKRVIDAVAVVQIAPRREPAQRRREPCVHCCSMSTSIDFQITMKDLAIKQWVEPSVSPLVPLYSAKSVPL